MKHEGNHEKSGVDVARFVRNVATKQHWQLNADKEFVEMLKEGLESNLERLGYLQCPCRLSWDDRERDKDIICPCTYAVDDIDEYGHCFCSLFFAHDYDFARNEPTSIPERRPEHLFP